MDSETADKIGSTWTEIGQRAKPLRDFVFVRTELLPEYVGSIWVPPAYRGNYTGMAHTVFMRALVIATGPECKVVSVGNRVAFARLFFARWHELEDKTLVGWVREDNIQTEIGENLEGGVPL